MLSNLCLSMVVIWWIRVSRSLISSKTSARWHEERWDHRKRTDSLEEEERSDGSLEPQKVSRSTIYYCLALITISMITKAGRTLDQTKRCMTKRSKSNKTKQFLFKRFCFRCVFYSICGLPNYNPLRYIFLDMSLTTSRAMLGTCLYKGL